MSSSGARAADAAATLLSSLISPAVRRAERDLLRGSFSSPAEHERALRTLLEFHQDLVSPVSAAFAYALPCGAALRAIVRHAPAGLIEPGAGTGLWAALARSCLPAVHASDALPSDFVWDGDLRVAAAGDGPDATAAAEDARALLLCWPPLELEAPPPALPGREQAQHEGAAPRNTMAREALAAYRGRTLLYVGEWRGSTGVISALSARTAACGQCAGAVFQRAVEDEWELVERVALPRWPGFADALHVFRRKGERTGEAAGPAAAAQSAAAASGAAGDGRSVASRACLDRRLQALAALGLTQPPVLAAAISLDAHLASTHSIDCGAS